jgi:hypothetical protein
LARRKKESARSAAGSIGSGVEHMVIGALEDAEDYQAVVGIFQHLYARISIGIFLHAARKHVGKIAW